MNRRRTWRPAFFVYSLFLLLSCAVCFVVLYSQPFSEAQYERVYWIQTAIDALFGFAAIGEVTDLGISGSMLGIGAAFILFTWSPPQFSISYSQWVEGSLAAAAVLVTIFGPKRNRMIGSGFIVLYLFPAILYIPQVPNWTRFIPVLAWILATVIWFFSD